MQEKAQVSQSILGRGVFAKIPLEPRETILYLTGRLIGFAATLEPEGEYAVQIARDAYVAPLPPSRFLNHSCAPNAGFVDEIRLIALRQIKPGEEIRFDYSTTMLERHWELDCSCGSPRCRGKIRDFDLLPPELQRHYLRLGVVQNFIAEQLPVLAPRR